MPESLVYLLFAMGVVLLIGGIARPYRLGESKTTPGLSARDRFRTVLFRYRRAVLILGVIVAGLVWYAGNTPSTPAPDDPEPEARYPAAETVDPRMFKSDFIEIELPGGWTATDAHGLDIPDLDYSDLPRAFQVSISAIPMENE